MTDNISEEIPELLRPLVPLVGSLWEWEPLKPHARARALVSAVRWNGEEVWVESVCVPSRPARGDGKAWNTLSRWVEATVMIDPGPDNG